MFACGNSGGGGGGSDTGLTVQLALECNSTNCTTNREITNTIKDDYLPTYTVSRNGDLTSDLILTMKWSVSSSNGNGMATKYYGDIGFFGSQPNQGYPVLYKFYFISGGTRISTIQGIVVDDMAQTFTITIPAGVSSQSFRLKPSQEPYASTPVSDRATPGSFGTINIEIENIVTANSGHTVSTTASSEELKINYDNKPIDSDN